MPFISGENVGPYRIIEQLGQGGMATVYKAYHPALDRYVAIKALHPAFMEDPNFLARFQREARLVAKLEHPNIIPIYDASDHEGRPYLVMKFVQGKTLKEHLAHTALTNAEKLRIIEAVGSALKYAHQQGILHRDVKPSNIIIADDGQIFLADFGLARIASAGESTLSSDMFIGTPQYISPEQAQGRRDLDEGTDIYSFGVVLYEMMVGKVPFSADTPYAIIHDHIFSPLPMPRSINPALPEAMELVLLKALAKNRADRFKDIGELIEAVRAAFPEMGEISPSKTLQVSQETIQTPLAAAASPVLPIGEDSLQQSAASETVFAPAPSSPAEGGGESQEAPGKKKPKRSRWLVVLGGLLLLCMCLAVLGVLNRRNLRQEVEPQATTKDAIALAQEQVSGAPEDPTAHLNLAVAYAESGDVDRAKQEYQKALDLAGDDLGFYALTGETLLIHQDWLTAAEIYLKLAEKHPKPIPPELIEPMHEAWYKASEFKSFPEAVPFDDLLKLDPLMAGVAKARNELYQGGPLRARAILMPVLEKNPEFIEARLVQIEMLIRNHNPEEAQKLLDNLPPEDKLPPWIAREVQRLKDINQP